ncbi:hypothetical protein ALC60_03519 [Trachymyrmex zeteki]|uniref:Uncharacterized protein n=1 Tax=Mycetomoellerius zeteki TaxID=64791 RepID=A0A151XB32_9HYME|nr:hypothetical protein ALC60_03519 [Trachymyrmex zeteki]
MQLAPTKRTPVALPRFSAGVSKSTKYGVYTRGLVSREAPSCPTGQTTSRTIAGDGECPRTGASETAARSRGERSRRSTAKSAVGPVPRKEALFH